MTQTEQEIEKLRTLNDNYTELVDIFNHIVPREYVVLTLSAPSDVDWTMYSVVVTNNDKGTSDTYDIPSNGVLEFEVKYDTTYTIKLPTLVNFIAPKDLTFTAGMKMREVGYSYRIVGMFGMDANGKCYTIEQIAALDDKSIIKYGGISTQSLENSLKEDGSYGNSMMWKIGEEFTPTKMQNLTAKVEAELELIPIIEGNQITNNINLYYDGETYTDYLILESKRLSADTPMSRYCREQTITINGKVLRGFVPSPIQYKEIINNIGLFKELYIALGRETIDFKTSPYTIFMTSCLYKNSSGIINAFTRVSLAAVCYNNYTGTEVVYCFVAYPLP